MTSPTQYATKLVTRTRNEKSALQELYGDDYDAILASIDDPHNHSRPDTPISAYTDERLQRCLAYANRMLRCGRSMAPLGAILTQLYEDIVLDALSLQNMNFRDTDAQQNLDLKLEVIRDFERPLLYSAYLGASNTPAKQKWTDEIMKLMRNGFAARYNHIFEVVCAKTFEVRDTKDGLTQEVVDDEFWKDATKNLPIESRIREQIDKGERPWEVCPIHRGMFSAAHCVSLRYQEVLSMTLLYTETNELYGGNLMELIKTGDGFDIARRLHNDYCDIPRIMLPHDRRGREIMFAILEGLIDKLFDRGQYSPDEFSSWTPTYHLGLLVHRLQNNDNNETDYNDFLENVIDEVSIKIDQAKWDFRAQTTHSGNFDDTAVKGAFRRVMRKLDLGDDPMHLEDQKMLEGLEDVVAELMREKIQERAMIPELRKTLEQVDGVQRLMRMGFGARTMSDVYRAG